MAHRRPDCSPRSALRLALPMALVFALFASTSPGYASELRRTPIVQAVQSARPSVVNIRGEKVIATGVVTSHGETAKRVNGMGTGVVIDSHGYILTNHHVVEGVREIQVTLASGHTHIARLVEHDSETDLAIIKIDPVEELPVIHLGNSSDLMPGEPVVAVGNAYGYEHTVTRGIISALHRAVQVSDAQFYDDLIQTDASINPGNSGGPLLNIDGEMIGINVAVRAGAQGIGFAIPVDKALGVTSQLLAKVGNSSRHGIAFLADGPGTDDGLVVTAVAEGSPAAKAGIVAGDVVVRLDDQAIERELDFHRSMLDRSTGDSIGMLVRRDGEDFSCTMTLEPSIVTAPPRRDDAWEKLGISLEIIPEAQFHREIGAELQYRGGFRITQVRDASPAQAKGILTGDILVGMHIWETTSWADVSYILNSREFRQLEKMKFYVIRDGKVLYEFFPLTAKRDSTIR